MGAQGAYYTPNHRRGIIIYQGLFVASLLHTCVPNNMSSKKFPEMPQMLLALFV